MISFHKMISSEKKMFRRENLKIQFYNIDDLKFYFIPNFLNRFATYTN
jgi:hypothetical protein